MSIHKVPVFLSLFSRQWRELGRAGGRRDWSAQRQLPVAPGADLQRPDHQQPPCTGRPPRAPNPGLERELPASGQSRAGGSLPAGCQSAASWGLSTVHRTTASGVLSVSDSESTFLICLFLNPQSIFFFALFPEITSFLFFLFFVLLFVFLFF